jgi:iron complex transport system ATP-binding protein
MLRLTDLNVSYGRRRVLEGVTLDVESGEVMALVGPNGAGKSTLIRAVSGVVPMQSGEVRVNGKVLHRLSTMERARYLAVVPQARSLPPAFTVYESVLLGRTPHRGWLGRAGEGDRERVQHALEQTQLLPLAERYVGELSGGEQQRVLLARALATDPDLLVLDEPTVGMDVGGETAIIDFLRELSRQRRVTILIVTHLLPIVLNLASTILLMNACTILHGSVDEVLQEDRLTALYGVPVRMGLVAGQRTLVVERNRSCGV